MVTSSLPLSNLVLISFGVHALEPFHSLNLQHVAGQKSKLRPISAETIEIMAQAESLMVQLRQSDTGGMNRSIQDLTQFYHATKESYIASLIVVSGILSFFTAIIFTIGNIGAAASDNRIQGFRTLVRIGTNSFGFVTPITALLAMFHRFRKLFVLWALSGKLGSKLRGGIESAQADNIKTVRSVTRTQELSVLMRFTASAAAGVSLYWQWVNAEPLRDEPNIQRKIPGFIGGGALILHILSIFFLIIIEYFIRYNFDPKLGEYLGESFRDEITEMYQSFSMPMKKHMHPLTQLPLPLMLKQSTLKIALPPNDQVILCRSIVPHKECFQDNNYLSIFIITLFMPYKNAFHFLLTG